MNIEELKNYIDRYSDGAYDRLTNNYPIPDTVTIPKYCFVSMPQNNVSTITVFFDRVDNASYPRGWYTKYIQFTYWNGSFVPFITGSSGLNPYNPYFSGNYGNNDNDNFRCATEASFSSSSGGSSDNTVYTEFWFPVVSIVAILFIFNLIYKIIIRRLMP